MMLPMVRIYRVNVGLMFSKAGREGAEFQKICHKHKVTHGPGDL